MNWQHLLWIIPVSFLAGLYLEMLRPRREHGKCANFEDRPNTRLFVRGRSRFAFGTTLHEQMEAYQSAMDASRRQEPTLFNMQVFDQPGHGRTFGPNQPIPTDLGEGLHPGRPCSPQCWRKPNGHRLETS